MVYEKPKRVSASRKALDIGSSLHGNIGKGKVFI